MTAQEIVYLGASGDVSYVIAPAAGPEISFSFIRCQSHAHTHTYTHTHIQTYTHTHTQSKQTIIWAVPKPNNLLLHTNLFVCNKITNTSLHQGDKAFLIPVALKSIAPFYELVH